MEPSLEVTYEFHSIDPQDYRNLGYGSRKGVITLRVHGYEGAEDLVMQAAAKLDLLPGEYLAIQRPHEGAEIGEGAGTFIPGWSLPVKVTAAKKLYHRNR